MKLLFDENLAPKLAGLLDDLFVGSAHVGELGLKSAPDLVVWETAANLGYTIVSKDADFRERSILYGHPPKVIWIRLGNCTTRGIGDLIRSHHGRIRSFLRSKHQSFLALV